ncbi:MAG: hypothetical protein WBE72_10505 [Terracidiphilus sp.]
MPATTYGLLLADRIWIAVALLHQEYPGRVDFSRDEIRRKLDESGLANGIERGSVNAHLKEHLVANVPPSSSKYRMLYETRPGGNLRLYRPGDFTFATRFQKRKPSKSVPKREEIPEQYWQLLDWYEEWSKEPHASDAPINWEDDPLIRLIGSGKHIWADEHADEYVENLRREDG